MKKLMNKNFVLLWQAQVISQFGVQATAIAMAFWIKHTTGSATLMGTCMMIAALPTVLLQPFGGVIADRFSRKRLLVVCDCIAGIVLVSLSALLFFVPHETNVILVALMVTSATIGTLDAFSRPAVWAAVPSLVPEEKLATANSLQQSTFELSSLVGSGVGGVLFRILGAPLLFLFDGISYLYAAFSESFMQVPQTFPEKVTAKNALRQFKLETKEGFQLFWSFPGMRTFFVLLAFHNFFIVPCTVLLPFYVEDHLAASSDWYGYLLAALGLGGILGCLAAGAVRMSSKVRGITLWVFLIVIPFLVLLVGMTRNLLIAGVSITLFGMIEGYLNVHYVTVIQESVRESFRGRILGIYGTVASAIYPIAMGLTGVVTDLLGGNVALVFTLCGTILATITCLVTLNPAFRAFLELRHPAEPEEMVSLLEPSSAV